MIFLSALVFWIGFLPLFEITGLINFLEFVVINVVIISALYFFHRSKKKFQVYVLIPLCVIFTYLNQFNESSLLAQIDRFLILLLFFFITLHFITTIFKSKEVDLEVIIISVAAYILIGLMASILCWFTDNLYPGAYNIVFDEDGPIMNFTYYAIVTMSTLGYGDITPQIPQSKSLAIVITLIGQFYMAILIAFLMGKFLHNKTK